MKRGAFVKGLKIPSMERGIIEAKHVPAHCKQQRLCGGNAALCQIMSATCQLCIIFRILSRVYAKNKFHSAVL